MSRLGSLKFSRGEKFNVKMKFKRKDIMKMSKIIASAVLASVVALAGCATSTKPSDDVNCGKVVKSSSKSEHMKGFKDAGNK